MYIEVIEKEGNERDSQACRLGSYTTYSLHRLDSLHRIRGISCRQCINTSEAPAQATKQETALFLVRQTVAFHAL